MTTTELVKPADIAATLLDGSDVAVLDEVDIQQDIIRRILASEDLAQAFAQAEATPALELDGQLITVHGVQWAKSGFADGPAVFALLDVTRDKSAEHEVVSMGGRSLMASFLYAQINGHYPFSGTLRVRQSKTNPDRKFWTFTVEQ